MSVVERGRIGLAIAWFAIACSGVAHGRVRQDAAELRAEAVVLESIGMERGVDRVDLEQALSMYSKALKSIGDPAEQEALSGEIRSIENRLAHRRDGIAGYSPIMPAIIGTPQLLERLDDPSETALESGVLLFLEAAKLGLIRSDQYHLAILSQEHEESDEALVQMLLYRETTQELLNAGALASLIDPGEVESLRTSANPLESLSSLAAALEARGLGKVRVGVLQVPPPRRSGDIVARDLNGRFLSADGRAVVSRTETGFAQFVGVHPWLVATLMLASVILIQRLVTSIVRGADPKLAAATSPPWWLGVACGVAAYAISTLACAGIGVAGIDPETLSMSPRGLVIIAGISATLMLLPGSLLLVGLTRVPAFVARIGNGDLVATILVGGCFGAFVFICEIACSRMEFSGVWPSILAGAASCIAIAGVLGVAFAKGLRGDRSWIAAAVVAAVSSVAVMAEAIRFEAAGAPIAAAAGICIALAIPPIVRRATRPADGEDTIDGSMATTARSLRQRVTAPPYALVPALESQCEQAIAWIGDRSWESGLRLLLVTGRGGSGKSRFLSELIRTMRSEHIQRDERFEAFVGDCDDPSLGGGTVPFEPFQQAMGAILGVSAMAGPGEAMLRLRSGMAAKGLQAALGTVGMGSLAGLLDAGGDEAAAKSAGRVEAARALATVLEHRARDSAIALAIDDAQWIDAESEHVLRAMMHRLASSDITGRVALILLTRSDADAVDRLRGAFPAGAAIRHVDLDRVIETDGVPLRSRILEGVGFDVMSRRRLELELDHRTIENPASILSFLTLLLSRDALVERGSEIAMVESTDLGALPPIDDPTRMLGAMTSDMGRSAIEALQCASIIGMRFRASILAEIFNLDILDLIRDLQQAEGQGLVRDVLDADDCYEFADRRVAAAFRADARRSMLGGGDRQGIPQAVREYHRRYVRVAGTEIESRWGGEANAPYSELLAIAEHAMQLRDSDPRSATRWSMALADRSLARGLAGAARRALEPVFEIVQQRPVRGLAPETRFSLARGLVRAIVDEGGEGELLDRAIEDGDRVAAEVIGASQSPDRIAWDLLVAEGLYRNRRFDDVIARTSTLTDAEGAEPAARLRASFLAAASMSPADYSARNDALEAIRRELHSARAEASGDRLTRLLRIEAETLNTLGFGLLRDPSEEAGDRAMACFEAALAINRGEIAPDRRGERISLGGLGDVLQRLGRIAEAESRYARNLDSSREDGDLAGVTRMTSMLASIAISRCERGESSDRAADLSRIELLLAESLESADRQRNADGAAFALASMIREAMLAGRDTASIAARIEDRKTLLEGCRQFSRDALRQAMSAAGLAVD